MNILEEYELSCISGTTEAQGLAYSAFAYYGTPDKPTKRLLLRLHWNTIGQATGSDVSNAKTSHGFSKSEGGFEIARNAILNQIESERITRPTFF
jgi:hypothetical protein